MVRFLAKIEKAIAVVTLKVPARRSVLLLGAELSAISFSAACRQTKANCATYRLQSQSAVRKPLPSARQRQISAH